MSKLLATELSDKLAYQCLQMFGGYGYMEEYKAAQFFRDSRLGTIGGGSSEIMREIIAKMVIDDIDYEKREVRNEIKNITIDELFATLPARFKKEKVNENEMNVLFEFEENLHYSILINKEDLSIQKGKNQSNFDLIITTNTATYIEVETGKLNPQEAFMQGKIQVSDLSKMMQFGTMFRKFNNESMK